MPGGLKIVKWIGSPFTTNLHRTRGPSWHHSASPCCSCATADARRHQTQGLVDARWARWSGCLLKPGLRKPGFVVFCHWKQHQGNVVWSVWMYRIRTDGVMRLKQVLSTEKPWHWPPTGCFRIVWLGSKIVQERDIRRFYSVPMFAFSQH